MFHLTEFPVEGTCKKSDFTQKAYAAQDVHDHRNDLFDTVDKLIDMEVVMNKDLSLTDCHATLQLASKLWKF